MFTFIVLQFVIYYVLYCPISFLKILTALKSLKKVIPLPVLYVSVSVSPSVKVFKTNLEINKYFLDIFKRFRL